MNLKAPKFPSRVGCVVLTPTRSTCAAAVLPVQFFSRRIVIEEEALEGLFPNQYAAYRARTWLCIPVYRVASSDLEVDTNESEADPQAPPQDALHGE